MIRSMSEDRSGNATGETVTVEVDPVTGARKLSTSSSRKTSNNSTINSAGSASGSSSSARKKKDSIGLLSRTIVKEQFRLPGDCLEKMPSANNSPMVSRRGTSRNISNLVASLAAQQDSVADEGDEGGGGAKAAVKLKQLSVASMVQRFESEPRVSDRSRARGASTPTGGSGGGATGGNTPVKNNSPNNTKEIVANWPPAARRSRSSGSSAGEENQQEQNVSTTPTKENASSNTTSVSPTKQMKKSSTINEKINNNTNKKASTTSSSSSSGVAPSRPRTEKVSSRTSTSSASPSASTSSSASKSSTELLKSKKASIGDGITTTRGSVAKAKSALNSGNTRNTTTAATRPTSTSTSARSSTRSSFTSETSSSSSSSALSKPRSSTAGPIQAQTSPTKRPSRTTAAASTAKPASTAPAAKPSSSSSSPRTKPTSLSAPNTVSSLKTPRKPSGPIPTKKTSEMSRGPQTALSQVPEIEIPEDEIDEMPEVEVSPDVSSADDGEGDNESEVGDEVKPLQSNFNNQRLNTMNNPKVNRRSESDGIVVAERPRPDKPVRRCESTDEVTSEAVLNASYQQASRVSTEASATILHGPEDVTAVLGQSVELQVQFFGNPEPKVSWFKNGKQTETRITVKPGVSTITLKDVRREDSGKYQVKVENSLGADVASASVSVEGPPDPPAGRPYVSDIDKENSSLTLAWYGSTFDGGSIIVGYTVEMASRPLGIKNDSMWPASTAVEEWQCLDAECRSTSFIVRRLDIEREYVFRVRAANVHGHSEPGHVSDPVSFMASAAPSGRAHAHVSKAPDSVVAAKTREHVRLERSASAIIENENNMECFQAPFKHRIVCLQDGSAFKERYEIYEELGRGRFGVVFKVKDRSQPKGQEQEHFAAKFVRCRKREERQKVRDEIDIMNGLEHPRLLQLAAAYENPKEIIMVMEYIGGGELFEKVVADDFTLTERDCMLFMRQICAAIGYMHSKSIVHLDLKPENILCRSKDSHQIKIIDFGLARKLKPDEEVRILFGTPEFVSPEVINYEPVTTTSDMWSVGVVCYVLLSGLSPFMGDSDVETFANITGIAYDFDDEAFEPISEDAKDFIRKLLVKNQRKRMTATDCLGHRWLATVESAQTPDGREWKELNTEKLKSFLMRRRWQKAAHAIRALGRFTSLGFRNEKDNASSILSTQSAAF